jgi:hypothetical protein
VELKPTSVETRMMLCRLDEFEGIDRQNCKACYLEVVKLLAESGDTLNYVFALLMAEHPDAEEEKAKLLESVAADSGKAQIYHDVLDDFDRMQVLRETFGQGFQEAFGQRPQSE